MYLFTVFTGFVYRSVMKPVLFLMNPEWVHDVFIACGERMQKYALFRWCLRMIAGGARPASLRQKICGITFENPFGIAGGFDKDARLTSIFPALNFGFMEVGSITLNPYDGNPRPRLIRLPKTRSIWVNYGLKNRGASVVSDSLKNRTFDIPLFVNIAKTNCKETVDRDVAIADYCDGMEYFRDIAHCYTVNISCPNAFGGQPFHDPDDLEALLRAIVEKKFSQPLFLKISPDLTFENVDQILVVASRLGIAGIIVSNLKKKRVLKDIHPSERSLPEHGGLSGGYLRKTSNDMLAHITRAIKSGACAPFILIGLGGVDTARDAYEKIRLGAHLIQFVSGMIFQGPQICGELVKGLDELIRADGFTSIEQVRGIDVVA